MFVGYHQFFEVSYSSLSLFLGVGVLELKDGYFFAKKDLYVFYSSECLSDVLVKTFKQFLIFELRLAVLKVLVVMQITLCGTLVAYLRLRSKIAAD